MNKIEMAYIGRRSCGCVVACTVDNPERRKEVRAFVNSMLKDGLDVERMTVKEARPLFQECTHGIWESS